MSNAAQRADAVRLKREQERAGERAAKRLEGRVDYQTMMLGRVPGNKGFDMGANKEGNLGGR